MNFQLKKNYLNNIFNLGIEFFRELNTRKCIFLYLRDFIIVS
jgi:hypothetical protein